MSEELDISIASLDAIFAAQRRDRASRAGRDLELLELMLLHHDDDLESSQRPVVFELVHVRAQAPATVLMTETWQPLAAGVRERLRPRQELVSEGFAGESVAMTCTRTPDDRTVQVSLEGASFRSRVAATLVVSYSDGSQVTFAGEDIKWGGAWIVDDPDDPAIASIQLQVTDDGRS